MPVVILIEYLMFILPAALLCVPVMLSRWKQAGLGTLDILAVLIPGWIWLILVTFDSRDKSLSNYIELPVLAAAVFLGVLLRCFKPECVQRYPGSLLLLAYAVVITCAAYFFFPGLPE